MIGAKQNRVLEASVLVPASTTQKIPVACVEAGRWHDRGVSKPPAVVAEALELALALPREELNGGVIEADALLKAQAGR